MSLIQSTRAPRGPTAPTQGRAPHNLRTSGLAHLFYTFTRVLSFHLFINAANMWPFNSGFLGVTETTNLMTGFVNSSRHLNGLTPVLSCNF